MNAPLALPPARPEELLRYTQAELDALFELLPAPAAAAAEGTWRGELMAITGLGWLPRAMASAVYRVLATPVNPWRAKSFSQGRGANRWFTVHGAEFARYSSGIRKSPVDGHDSFWLDYDIPENLALLRGIRGEARVLGDNLLLCRMNWQGKAALHRVLYFTLTRAD